MVTFFILLIYHDYLYAMSMPGIHWIPGERRENTATDVYIPFAVGATDVHIMKGMKKDGCNECIQTLQ